MICKLNISDELFLHAFELKMSSFEDNENS